LFKLFASVFFILGNVVGVYAQNIIRISDGTADLNDTILVSIQIANDQAFIAFQFDIAIPESFTYVENSAQLSNRESGHSLSVIKVSDTLFRFLAFSMQNSAFSGDSGEVMRIELHSGDTPGIYELELNNAVISDPSSHNILNLAVNGVWTIGAVGFWEFVSPEMGSAFPNPGSINEMSVKLNISKAALYSILLTNSEGKVCTSRSIHFHSGRNCVRVEDLAGFKDLRPGIYFLSMARTDMNAIENKQIKLILTD